MPQLAFKELDMAIFKLTRITLFKDRYVYFWSNIARTDSFECFLIKKSHFLSKTNLHCPFAVCELLLNLWCPRKLFLLSHIVFMKALALSNMSLTHPLSFPTILFKQLIKL